MAAIDDLLARIEDPALRGALERELAPLRQRQALGLVFERHLPEKVRLPGLAIQRGTTVELEADLESHTWHVSRVSADDVTITRRDQDGNPISERHKVGELVVVREFGQAIYPGLRSIGRITKGDSKPYHTILNSENFHALEMLLYTCEGKVDAIYIDPPYNSGAKDWKYNNNYVDKKDQYRNSKWLSFMEKRLRIAKRLLNPVDSVLIVAIDENEVHRLVLLLEGLFPSSKLQMVTVLINPAGATIIDQFHRVDEHLIFVHIGSAQPLRTVAETTILPSTKQDDDGIVKPKTFSWESLQRSGGNSRREDTKAKFFPVYIDETRRRIVGCGNHLPLGEDRNSAPPAPGGLIAQWPIKKDGTEACWQLSAPTFRQYLESGRIRLGRRRSNGVWGLSFLTSGNMAAIASGELVSKGKDNSGSLIIEAAIDRSRTRPGKTMWTNGAYSATEHGSTLLRKFLPGRRFPFPKSLYAVEDALRFYVGNKPDALVLDFFAGSGTTAHALMRLNHADGGRRRSVIVTNNEVSESERKSLQEKGLRPGDPEWESRGIYEYITKPRIHAAVTGRTPSGEPIDGDYRFLDEFPMADGFDENVEFFTMTYEDPERVQLGTAFEAIAPLLWLMAGAQGPRVESIDGQWSIPENGRYGVLFDVDAWPAFCAAAAGADGLTYAFVVTNSDAVFQRVVAELPDRITAVRLYESYLDSFAINTGSKL